MSALFVLKKPDFVHMLSDTLLCRLSDGIVISTNFSKCIAVPVLNVALGFIGAAKLGEYLAIRLIWEFDSFDDIVARGAEELPKIYAEFVEREAGANDVASIYLVGWREKTNRPAAFCMNLWADSSEQFATVSANTRKEDVYRFKLEEQTFIAGSPMPGQDKRRAAGFDTSRNADAMRPEIDLLHLLQIARQQRPLGKYMIGGKALLTSVDLRGISQRVVYSWLEDHDRIGKTIEPAHITNWREWVASDASSAQGRM